MPLSFELSYSLKPAGSSQRLSQHFKQHSSKLAVTGDDTSRRCHQLSSGDGFHLGKFYEMIAMPPPAALHDVMTSEDVSVDLPVIIVRVEEIRKHVAKSTVAYCGSLRQRHQWQQRP